MGRIATEFQGMEHKMNRNAGIKGSERVDSLVGTATITEGKSIYQSKILSPERPSSPGRPPHVQDTFNVKNTGNVNQYWPSSHRRQHKKERATQSTKNRHHKSPHTDEFLRMG